MLFTLVWRWKRFAGAVLTLGLAFVLVQAWPVLRNIFFNDSQPHFGELAQVNITGEWRTWRFWHSARLTVHKPVGGVRIYSVDFESSGCLSHWEAKRTGRYADSVLTLNEPVREYNGTTYRRLYSVRVAGTDYLVPDVHLDEFRKSLTAKDEFKRDMGIGRYSLCKQPPRSWAEYMR